MNRHSRGSCFGRRPSPLPWEPRPRGLRAPTHHADSRSDGHVYETTNASSGKAIRVFDRAADGRLTVGETVPIGGQGTGSSLHSQGGLVRDGSLLFAVNACSVHGLRTEDDRPWPRAARHDLHEGCDAGQRHDSGWARKRRQPGQRHHPRIPGHLSGQQPAALHPPPHFNPAGGSTDAAQNLLHSDGSALLVTEKASKHHRHVRRQRRLRAARGHIRQQGRPYTASTSTGVATVWYPKRPPDQRPPSTSAGASSASSQRR